MSALAPDFFDRRFDDLIEIARSRLPSLAPGWTDHNLHDPGITLIEMLAWVTEAQMYSLSRTRRDERSAYAALFGLAPRGPVPAAGLIWPERGAAQQATRSLVLPAGARARPEPSGAPLYRTLHRQLWLAGRIVALRTQCADGRVLDHGATNERGNVVFLPFGEQAGARDMLAMDIECPPDGGLFPLRRADADGAFLIVGVLADATSGNPADAPPQRLDVTLLAGAARHALTVRDDSTGGFMRSGVLALDVSGVSGSPERFTLEFRAPGGFARAPRASRIALNVIPLTQGSIVERELHVASALPDQVMRLEQPGLQFAAGSEPVKVEVSEDGALHAWTRRDRLDDCLPLDRVFALDREQGAICFGNGVNGRMPPMGAQVFLSYAVCDGADGNAARNQRWVVQGIDGVCGSNPQAMEGGHDGAGRLDQRREARRRARDEHALVTAEDLETAATALPALEVARAWSVPSADGVLCLVAMRARPGAVEIAGVPDGVPESARWLREVQRQLAPRIPMGLRLSVRSPRYIPFRIALAVESDEGYTESAVEAALTTALRERLALVAPRAGGMQRVLGLGITRRDVAAWVRAVDGVRRVLSLQLFDGAGAALDAVAVPRLGLPRFEPDASVVTVQRPARPGTR